MDGVDLSIHSEERTMALRTKISHMVKKAIHHQSEAFTNEVKSVVIDILKELVRKDKSDPVLHMEVVQVKQRGGKIKLSRISLMGFYVSLTIKRKLGQMVESLLGRPLFKSNHP
jgi:hypothetical protein